MSVPQNKSEFIDYCLRKLGAPVIKINVDSTQVDDRVSEALYRFEERHFRAVETIWAIFRPNHTDIHNGYVILPPEIVGVSDVFRASNTSNIYSIDFQMKLGELSALSKTTFAGVNYYYTIKQHLELLNEMFSPERQFDFNSLSHKLILAGGLKDVAFTEGVFAIRAYRRLADETNSDSNNIPVNIWADRWLQNYVTSLIKLQWSANLSKYQNINLLGGVQMNGLEMRAEAEKEIEALEQQLLDEYSEPIIGFYG